MKIRKFKKKKNNKKTFIKHKFLKLIIILILSFLFFIFYRNRKITNNLLTKNEYKIENENKYANINENKIENEKKNSNINQNKIKNEINNSNINENKNESKYRVLVYTCTDEQYSHYIPLFCNTILRADKLKQIDIEICTSLYKLSNEEEKALDYLRNKYTYSKIIIHYNTFIKNISGTFYNNTKLSTNSVRFVTQPTIKNKYVYITDVDMIIFVDNFYLDLIDDMKRKNNSYSNYVRYGTNRLTGLHFTEYDAYYPVPKQTNYKLNDEELLYNIVKSKGIKIDSETEYRPTFGIHASPNRPRVNSLGFVGWGAENYRFSWINYCKSNDFKFIYPLLDISIKKKFFKINKYYGIDEKEFNRFLNYNNTLDEQK